MKSRPKMRWGIFAACTALCGPGGCLSALPLSENSIYRVEMGLDGLPRILAAGDVVVGLQGSRVCPEVTSVEGAEIYFLNGGGGCFLIQPDEGVLEFDDDGCFILERAARLSIETTELCEYADGPARDSIEVGVAPLDEVEVEVVSLYDAFGRALLVGADGRALPNDIFPRAGEPIFVAEGEPFVAGIGVWHDGVPVGVGGPEISSIAEATAGSVEILSERTTDLAVVLKPETTVEVGLEVHDVRVQAGVLQSVPLSRAASLEIVAGYGEDRSGGVALRAVVRDAQGRLLYGMPVAWETEREPFLSGFEAASAGADYAVLEDVCVAPPARPTERRAVVTATLGGLSDSLEVSWIAMPADDDDDEFEPDPRCVVEGGEDGLTERGCGCQQSSSGGHWGWLAMVLFLWRRRSAVRGRKNEAGA